MWPVLAAETYAAYGFEYSRVDVATGNALVHETWTTGLKRKQILPRCRSCDFRKPSRPNRLIAFSTEVAEEQRDKNLANVK